MTGNRYGTLKGDPRLAQTSIDAIVGNQFDGVRSGVARFNRILSERLEVPAVAVDDPRLTTAACPLLSVKFGELRPGEGEALSEHLAGRGGNPFRMFLHDLTSTPLETDCIRRASLIYTGNAELTERVRTLNPLLRTLWSPATILDRRRVEAVDISAFSFGMAHKMRTDMFQRLYTLLDGRRTSYSLFVSNANHESARVEDAQAIYQEMHAVFPRNLYFLGNLSDVAVSNLIARTTYFAAFYPRGARANNSTIVAAMEHGATVITNLDEHSPPYLRHLETVIDIARCDRLPSDQAVRGRIGAAGQQAVRGLSWDHLLDQLT